MGAILFFGQLLHRFPPNIICFYQQVFFLLQSVSLKIQQFFWIFEFGDKCSWTLRRACIFYHLFNPAVWVSSPYIAIDISFHIRPTHPLRDIWSCTRAAEEPELTFSRLENVNSRRRCTSAHAHHTMLHLQSFSWLLRHSYEEKNCQRHNGPKALSTLTQSTLLVQALKSWSNFGYIVNELRVSIFISQSHISQVSTKSVSQSQGKARQGNNRTWVKWRYQHFNNFMINWYVWKFTNVVIIFPSWGVEVDVSLSLLTLFCPGPCLSLDIGH